VAAAATAFLLSAVPGPPTAYAGKARSDGWSEPRAITGPGKPVVLDDGSTIFISVGGPRDGHVFAQRQREDGTRGPRTEIGALFHDCVVSGADAEGMTAAAGVTCYRGGEDPVPWTLALVRRGSGWKQQVLRDAEVVSVDVAPAGFYAVVGTASSFGNGGHTLRWHRGDGFSDLRPPTHDPYSADVSAVGDRGQLAVLAVDGFEDEPGFFTDGYLRLLRRSERNQTWRMVYQRDLDDRGLSDARIELDRRGRLFGAYTRSLSTGGRWPREDRSVWLVSQSANIEPRLTKASADVQDVLSLQVGQTTRGTGTAAWQLLTHDRRVITVFANRQRTGETLRVRMGVGTPTRAVRAGYGLSLDTAGTNKSILSWVAHRQGSGYSVVSSRLFAYVHRPTTQAALRRGLTVLAPMSATVAVARGSGGDAALAIGRLGRYQLRPATVLLTRG
jgi:hypothetical protein